MPGGGADINLLTEGSPHPPEALCLIPWSESRRVHRWHRQGRLGDQSGIRCLYLVCLTLILHAVLFLAASPARAYVIDSHWPTGFRELTILNTQPRAGWSDALRDGIAIWNSAGADIHLAYSEQEVACPSEGPRRQVPFCFDPSIAGGKYGVTFHGYTDSSREHTAWAIIYIDPEAINPNKAYIVCHELAHVVGISHGTGDTTACAGDRATEAGMLREMYGHSDEASTTATTALPSTTITAAPVTTATSTPSSIPSPSTPAVVTTTTTAFDRARDSASLTTMPTPVSTSHKADASPVPSTTVGSLPAGESGVMVRTLAGEASSTEQAIDNKELAITRSTRDSRKSTGLVAGVSMIVLGLTAHILRTQRWRHRRLHS